MSNPRVIKTLLTTYVVYQKKNNNADVWKYNQLLSFFYYLKCIYGLSEGESKVAEFAYTLRQWCSSSVKLFCFILNFCKISTGPSQGIKSSYFFLFRNFRESHTSQAFLCLSTLGSLAQSHMKSSSSSADLHVARVKIFSSLFNFLDTHANFQHHTSSLLPMHCMWTCLLLAYYPCNLRSTSVGEQPASCPL